MIRQLAEALDHAHRRHLYHRALAPRSVYVSSTAVTRGCGSPTGKLPLVRTPPRRHGAHPPNLADRPDRRRRGAPRHIERSAGPYLAPEFASPDSPALLDVFGLGALSYLILTGDPPAVIRGELATRLTQARALMPSAIIDSVSPVMDALVRDATQVYQADRTESVRQFLRSLDAIEEELTAPEADPE